MAKFIKSRWGAKHTRKELASGETILTCGYHHTGRLEEQVSIAVKDYDVNEAMVLHTLAMSGEEFDKLVAFVERSRKEHGYKSTS